MAFLELLVKSSAAKLLGVCSQEMGQSEGGFTVTVPASTIAKPCLLPLMKGSEVSSLPDRVAVVCAGGFSIINQNQRPKSVYAKLRKMLGDKSKTRVFCRDKSTPHDHRTSDVAPSELETFLLQRVFFFFCSLPHKP